MKPSISTVDEYINSFPEEIRPILGQIRNTIRMTAPGLPKVSVMVCRLSTHGKPLVYFAAYSHHIGFYATPTGHVEFSEQISKYKQGKGYVQFPLDKPMPFELIRKIAEFRVWENKSKVKGQAH